MQYLGTVIRTANEPALRKQPAHWQACRKTILMTLKLFYFAPVTMALFAMNRRREFVP